MASDLIYREDAKVFVRHACYKKINPIDYLDEVPAADVVEVVRCKDCIYYNTTGCAVGFGWCEEPTVSNGVDDNYYCAGGIRRDDDG